MTTVSELKYKYVPKLMDFGIEREEAVAEFELVIKSVCGCGAKEILLDFDLEESDKNKIKEFLNKRLEIGMPIQYVLGKGYFLGEEYILNQSTLIPRPETELLVVKAIELIKGKQPAKVLDIGTGSGCIACAIAKHVEDVEVIGVDISTSALQVAIKNAEKLGVIKKAMFRKSDIYSNVSEKFDLIVSNPPYIPSLLKASLQSEVKNFEPESALFTKDEKGLEFYEKIIEDAHSHLNLEGYLLFEIGQGQKEEVENILVEHSFTEKEIIKDFNDIDRVVVAQID